MMDIYFMFCESECVHANHVYVLFQLQVKDLVKTLVQEKDQTIKVLSDFALGKGGHYGSD
jgi:hypothetical protein